MSTISLIEELPKIVKEGKQEVQRILDCLSSNARIGLQTNDLVLPTKDASNWWKGANEQILNTKWTNFLRNYLILCFFLIALFLLSSCEKNNQIPFKNIPHKEYFDLKGPVKEVQVDGYICNISEKGFDSPETLDMRTYLPVNDMLFSRCYFGKNGIDICSTPVETYQDLYLFSLAISNISYSFTEQGYLSNVDLFWKDKRIKALKCTFNRENIISQMIRYESFTIVYDPDKNEWECIEQKDTIENTYLYDGFRILQTQIKRRSDSTRIYKTSYIFEQKDSDKVIERIYYGDDYVDSAYIFQDKNKDVYKIEHFLTISRSSKEQEQRTMFLKDNMVYKKLPDNDTNLYDEENRLIEDTQYKYTYNSNGLYQTIYEKREDILSTVSYEMDEYGNWTKMEITPARRKADKLYSLLKKLSEDNKRLQKEFESYDKMSYPPLARMEDILENLQKNTNTIKDIETIMKLCEQSFSKIIVSRNITYYE